MKSAAIIAGEGTGRNLSGLGNMVAEASEGMNGRSLGRACGGESLLASTLDALAWFRLHGGVTILLPTTSRALRHARSAATIESLVSS